MVSFPVFEIKMSCMQSKNRRGHICWSSKQRLITDNAFDVAINNSERRARSAFKAVTQNFFGNRHSLNCSV
jgi:hypothetical protein